jgi:hypothetical protein
MATDFDVVGTVGSCSVDISAIGGLQSNPESVYSTLLPRGSDSKLELLGMSMLQENLLSIVQNGHRVGGHVLHLKLVA